MGLTAEQVALECRPVHLLVETAFQLATNADNNKTADRFKHPDKDEKTDNH